MAAAPLMCVTGPIGIPSHELGKVPAMADQRDHRQPHPVRGVARMVAGDRYWSWPGSGPAHCWLAGSA
jgi:hypothetical protein